MVLGVGMMYKILIFAISSRKTGKLEAHTELGSTEKKNLNDIIQHVINLVLSRDFSSSTKSKQEDRINLKEHLLQILRAVKIYAPGSAVVRKQRKQKLLYFLRASPNGYLKPLERQRETERERAS
jgi:hypothetical protein